MSLTIRPLTDDDIDVAVEIERASAGWPWTRAMFVDELSQDHRAYWAAECDGTLVAFAGVMIVLGEAHITNIAVDPAKRRDGVGTALLLHAVRQAIARDCAAITLEVRVSNAPAIALYARFGFAPAGTRRAYYPDNQEDALILWAHDIDTAEYGVRLAGIAERLLARADRVTHPAAGMDR